MTRDQVLRKVAYAAAQAVADTAAEAATLELAREVVAAINALKSKPPEKSPEVGAASIATCEREIAALMRQVEDLKGDVGKVVEANVRIGAERDELRLLHKAAADAVAELSGSGSV